MANPHKGEVDVEVEGKVYTLRFSIDDICAIEEKAGKGLPALAATLSDPERMTITAIRVLFWGALRSQHKGITLLDAGNLIAKVGGIAKVVPLLSLALERAFPEEVATESPQQPGQ